jgi:hypothetical protein
MAGERRINWGSDATDAQYRTGDDAANNRFIVAEDLDGGTVLLEIDETAGEVVSRYPVNLSGNDLTNVGALDATSVSTGSVDITEETYVETSGSPGATQTAGTWDNIVDSVDEDNNNDMNASGRFVPPETAKYVVIARATVDAQDGDRVAMRVYNTTDGAELQELDRDVIGASGFPTLSGFVSRTFEAGKEYEIQATDDDSDFDVSTPKSAEIFKNPSNP